MTSIELSRELYSISNWNPKRFIYDTSYSDNWLRWVAEFGDGSRERMLVNAIPAYESTYLLYRLSEVSPGVRYVLPHPYDSIDLVMKAWYGKFIAYTPDMKMGDYPIADSPDDALAMLAIKLLKQGVLSKESETVS